MDLPMATKNKIMYVIKRNGELEEVSFDKIVNRLKYLSKDLNINTFEITQQICQRIHDKIKTEEIDELAAQYCSSMIINDIDYGKLASRLIISNHHKKTSPSFSEAISILYWNRQYDDDHVPLVSKELYEITLKNKEKLNSYIKYDRDYYIDYFGFKTLEKSYLLKSNNVIIERPQHMWLRVALGIHGNDIKDALETYDLLSQKYFTHATPTLFNCGTPRNQCSSCYLLGVDDSIKGIYKCLENCALISKYSGGIGIHVHNIRSKGSHIKGTNGTSTGIIPMLKVFNSTARYVDQGSKRLGSIAIYLEPWHADVFEFLELRLNHGNEEMRCRDLFIALWVCDLFMKRVESDSDWCLMDPNKSPGLNECYGKEFELLYEIYENEGRYVKKIKARDLWNAILKAQIETGTPYILYKDACNEKSNMKHYGTIKSSNLCAEVLIYSDEKETAICNLASVCLPTYIENGEFNFEKLHKVVKIITKNINKIIDKNFYPTEEGRLSNLKHRPIGIGIQGLADTFVLLKYPYDSIEAKELNKKIFATMYHAALEYSNELAKKRHYTVLEELDLNIIEKDVVNTKYPGAYLTFEESPASKGLLQFDLWGKEPLDMYDWKTLKENIVKYGLRNSLFIALMPVASTASIMGFNESFEPFTNNIYKRRVLSGEFILINKYLINDLTKLGLWNNDMKEKIMIHNGSVQNINEIPDDIKALYKTAWEIKQRDVIDLAIDRSIYVCQSQSLNIFMEEPNFKKLTSMHFYSWSKGSKISNYYLRTRARVQTQKFTIDPKKEKEILNESKKNIICDEENGVCLMCSS